MSQSFGKKSVAGPKLVKNVHGVKFRGLNPQTATPSRVTRSSTTMASQEASGSSKRTRSHRIKHVVLKKGGTKVSTPQDISDDSHNDVPFDDSEVMPTTDVNQESTEDLENLAKITTDPDVEQDVEPQQADPSPPGSEENSPTSSDENEVENSKSESKETPSVEASVQKTSTPSSKKGKTKVVSVSEEDDSDDETPIKETPVSTRSMKKADVSTSKKVADKKKNKKDMASFKTPLKSKTSQVPESAKKKQSENKKVKAEVSAGKKRKHVSESDSESDVIPDVPHISTTTRKRMKGKRIPTNVPDAPVDNVSFHFASSAQSWKFVVQRRLAIERELHEDALQLKEIMDLLVYAGLMRTVKDIGRCFVQLVREFIVNIPTDCDDESNTEYRKVYVRGKCVNFSPEVVNEFLGWSPAAVADEELDLNRVAKTLTGKLVRKWPKKGLLPSGKLTTKYVVLFQIGCANWMATNHLSGVIAPLAEMLYLIGTGGEFDFGKLVFDRTLKHAGSYAVRLPILFPCLLSEIIVHQHPNVVRDDEPLGKKPMPLKFDYRLFATTYVPNIVLTAAKGTASASGTQAVGSGKEDILAELRVVCNSLGDTIQACKIRKLNVDKLIKAMTGVPAAAEEEEAYQGTEDVADRNEEEPKESDAEEEAETDEVAEEEKEEDENENENAEDVTGSTSSSTRNTSL
ncbi:uncharacterized protein LOC130712508 [Lotus japonicus]|uniref:uncharacterized protein LOC130712508 n=1 Tax=Lotus japonicus TaxID=34305 RepID=UPI00258BEB7A|nr:uncharacterized protein LOC130712508 [Lotus japonicus]